jgi:hypothetical protein
MEDWEHLRQEIAEFKKVYLTLCVAAGAGYAAVCWYAERYIPGWPVWVELEVVGGVLVVWFLVRSFVNTLHDVLRATEVVRLFLATFVAVGLPITVWQVARALL